MRIEHETSERTALYMFSFISDGNVPLSGFIRPESGGVDAVVVIDGTLQSAVGGRRHGLHFQRSATGAVGIDQHLDDGSDGARIDSGEHDLRQIRQRSNPDRTAAHHFAFAIHRQLMNKKNFFCFFERADVLRLNKERERNGRRVKFGSGRLPRHRNCNVIEN